MTNSHHFPRFVVPIVAAVIFLITGYAAPQNSDDAATLSTSAALIDKGGFAIPHMQWLDDRVGIGLKGRDGLLYSKYGIGQVLLSAPLYALGRLIPSEPFKWAGYIIADSMSGARAALMVNALAGAVLLFVAGLIVEEKWCMSSPLSTTVLAFATPLFLASRGYGTEVSTALFLTIAVLCCLKDRRTLGMAFLCVAAFFRPVTLIFAVAWVVFLLNRPAREWVSCLLVFGIGVLGLGVFNYLRYGSFLQSGYAGESGFALQFIGLAGMLLSPGRSIILFMPIVLFLIPASARAVQERDKLFIGLFIGICLFFATHTVWREWHGGWSYGPRLLVPIIPILLIMTAPWLARRMAIPFVLLGLVIQLLTLLADPFLVLDAAIRNGVTFEESLWSLTQNFVMLQARILLTPKGIPVIACILIAAVAMIVAQAYVRASTLARNAVP